MVDAIERGCSVDRMGGEMYLLHKEEEETSMRKGVTD